MWPENMWEILFIVISSSPTNDDSVTVEPTLPLSNPSIVYEPRAGEEVIGGLWFVSP